MTSSRQTQLLLLVGTVLILGALSTEWWRSSPQGMRTVGEAIVLIAGLACAVIHCRRMPSGSPAVLYTTVIAGLVAIERPGGRLFPIILPAVVALVWAAVAFARSRAGVALTNVLVSGWRQEGHPRSAPQSPLP